MSWEKGKQLYVQSGGNYVKEQDLKTLPYSHTER